MNPLDQDELDYVADMTHDRQRDQDYEDRLSGRDLEDFEAWEADA